SHDQLPHRVELVVAGENHRFLGDPTMSSAAVVHLLLILFEENEVAEDIEKAFKLENLLPEIARAIAGFVDWVSCAADNLAGMTSAIEWQEEGLVSGQSGRHVDLVRISGEMY